MAKGLRAGACNRPLAGAALTDWPLERPVAKATRLKAWCFPLSPPVGDCLRDRRWAGAQTAQGCASPVSSPVRTLSFPPVVHSLALRPAAPPLFRQLIPRPGLCVTAPDSPRRQKAKRGIHQKEACYGGFWARFITDGGITHVQDHDQTKCKKIRED